MNTEILEGNKLIAEFMGCYGDTHWVCGEEVYRYGFKDTHITERWHESHFNEETPYNYSWDWLMPVVAKIDTAMMPDNYDNLHINGLSIFSEIEEVWEAVVEFIKWYNNHKN